MTSAYKKKRARVEEYEAAQKAKMGTKWRTASVRAVHGDGFYEPAP